MAIATVGSVSKTELAAGSSTISVNTVTGGSVGDLLVTTIATPTTTAVSAPLGWTAIPNASAPAGAAVRISSFYRFATGTEAASYTWTNPNSGFSVSGFMRRYSGVDSTTPFDPAQNYGSGSGTQTTFTVPSVNSTLAGGMLISGVALNGSSTVDVASQPSGMTIPTSGRTTGTGRRSAIAEQLLGAAGGAGSKTWTASVKTTGAAYAVVIRPAAPGAVAAPTASAGGDTTGTAGTTFTRTATETGSSISARSWTIVSGPSGAGSTIGSAAALSWIPPVPGTYVLRYSVTNPGGTATDDMTLTVGTPAPGSTLDVTATVEAGNYPPRVRLDVVDSSTLPYFSATVTRLNPDGTTSTVRTFDGNPLVLSTSGSTRVGLVYDYEMPYQAGVTYTTVEAPWSTSAEVTVPEDQVWLIHPAVPTLSVPVLVQSIGARASKAQRGVFYPMGRATPVVQTDGARKAAEFTLTVLTQSDAELDAMGALLSDASPLLLNVPATKSWGVSWQYVSVGDVTESRVVRIVTDPLRSWELPCQVVDMPVGGSQSERNYTDLLTYSSYSALMSAYPTYLALLSGP